MTPEQIPNTPSLSENVPGSAPAQSPGSIGFLPSLGILLLELILPVTLAGAFVYWLSGTIHLWSLNHVLALVIFAVIFVIISLFLTILLDGLTLPLRKRSSVKKIINPVGRRARLVKYVVVGILIPAGVFSAANLVVLPQGGTSMEVVEKHSQLLVKASPAAVFGDAILGSTSPVTKIQGIKALQAVHSPDSLDQLFRILTMDPAALTDAGVYETLSAAIASYGTDAKGGLFELYKNSDQLMSKTGGVPSRDAFSWYFSAAFVELRNEIQAQNPDQTSQNAELARLDAIQTTLMQSLTALKDNLPRPASASPAQDFVLHTFLAMDVKQDKEILQFARAIPADPAISIGVRGQALLLMAKLGGKDELDELYAYLGSSDETIKAKALEAITFVLSSSPVPEN